MYFFVQIFHLAIKYFHLLTCDKLIIAIKQNYLEKALKLINSVSIYFQLKFLRVQELIFIYEWKFAMYYKFFEQSILKFLIQLNRFYLVFKCQKNYYYVQFILKFIFCLFPHYPFSISLCFLLFGHQSNRFFHFSYKLNLFLLDLLFCNPFFKFLFIC